MSLIALVKDVGGTLETYFLTGTPTTCTLNLYTEAGALKVTAGSVTLDPVSTTVSTTAAAKATTLVLTSASNVVNGRRYIVGALASTEPYEIVTIKSLAASTATLSAPLLYGHTAGTPFKGLRAFYAVSSTEANALGWGWHADFIPSSGDPITEDVDCVKHKIADRLADESDLRQVFPKLSKIVDTELDIATSLRIARDNFLIDFGGKFRVYAALGNTAFRRPCALRWWLDRRFSLGADWAEDMDKVDAEYWRLIEKLRTQVAFDTDGDERTDGVDDAGWTVIQLDRA